MRPLDRQVLMETHIIEIHSTVENDERVATERHSVVMNGGVIDHRSRIASLARDRNMTPASIEEVF